MKIEARDVYRSKSEKKETACTRARARVDARMCIIIRVQSLVNRRDMPPATSAFTFPHFVDEGGVRIKSAPSFDE